MGRRSSPKRVEELDDSVFSFRHHIVEHIDDVVVVLRAVLDDLLDGDVELLVVPDDLRDILLDVVRVFLRDDDILSFFIVLRADDIPFFFSSFSLCMMAIFPCLPSVSICRTPCLLSSVTSSPCRTLCLVVEATTVTGAEPAEPSSFSVVWVTTVDGAEPTEPAGAEPAEPSSFMGVNSARLMGA